MAKRRSAPPARTDTEALVYRWGPSIDTQLLDLALTHRSYAHENGGLPTNERLEFLGDSVLGIIVTEYLYRTHPEVPEGQLAKMRAATVSEPALAAVARDLGLGEFIKLGKGEALSGGRDKDSILSDTVEALIGATYLTHGLEETRTVVTRLVSRFLDSARTRGAGLDWKTSLQELTAVHQLGNPAYEVTGTGPDHQHGRNVGFSHVGSDLLVCSINFNLGNRTVGVLCTKLGRPLVHLFRQFRSLNVLEAGVVHN